MDANSCLANRRVASATTIYNNNSSKIFQYLSFLFLLKNYPNPFGKAIPLEDPSTAIEYSIPNVGTGHDPSLRLKDYNVLRRDIATLVNKQQQPGNYKVKFNASNLARGINFYRIAIHSDILQSVDFSLTKEMILLR